MKDFSFEDAVKVPLELPKDPDMSIDYNEASYPVVTYGKHDTIDESKSIPGLYLKVESLGLAEYSAVGNFEFTTDIDFNINADRDINLNAGRFINLISVGAFNIYSDADITIESAKNILIKGGLTAKLESSGSTIGMDSSGAAMDTPDGSSMTMGGGKFDLAVAGNSTKLDGAGSNVTVGGSTVDLTSSSAKTKVSNSTVELTSGNFKAKASSDKYIEVTSTKAMMYVGTNKYISVDNIEAWIKTSYSSAHYYNGGIDFNAVNRNINFDASNINLRGTGTVTVDKIAITDPNHGIDITSTWLWDLNAQVIINTAAIAAVVISVTNLTTRVSNNETNIQSNTDGLALASAKIDDAVDGLDSTLSSLADQSNINAGSIDRLNGMLSSLLVEKGLIPGMDIVSIQGTGSFLLSTVLFNQWETFASSNISDEGWYHIVPIFSIYTSWYDPGVPGTVSITSVRIRIEVTDGISGNVSTTELISNGTSWIPNSRVGALNSQGGDGKSRYDRILENRVYLTTGSQIKIQFSPAIDTASYPVTLRYINNTTNAFYLIKYKAGYQYAKNYLRYSSYATSIAVKGAVNVFDFSYSTLMYGKLIPDGTTVLQNGNTVDVYKNIPDFTKWRDVTLEPINIFNEGLYTLTFFLNTIGIRTTPITVGDPNLYNGKYVRYVEVLISGTGGLYLADVDYTVRALITDSSGVESAVMVSNNAISLRAGDTIKLQVKVTDPNDNSLNDVLYLSTASNQQGAYLAIESIVTPSYESSTINVTVGALSADVWASVATIFNAGVLYEGANLYVMGVSGTITITAEDANGDPVILDIGSGISANALGRVGGESVPGRSDATFDLFVKPRADIVSGSVMGIKILLTLTNVVPTP